jgi:hypothetical protein
MVDPVVAIKTLLLREAMPDVTLRPGASVVARVASRGDGVGVLVLAGVPLTAQLPDEVPAGATLRLKVADVTPERVTLQLDGPPLVPGTSPPPQAPPQGAGARVAVADPPRRRSERGEEHASVVLAFHSDVLGRLDLRIDLGAGSVDVVVDAAAGDVHDLVQSAAPTLRDALAGATARDASVRVHPRRDPVDLYA